MRFLSVALGFGGAVVFTACAPSAPETADFPADDTAEAPIASRVVALTTLSADLVQTLDADALVGTSGSRLLAADSRFADIPTVSEGRTEPDLEKIVALEPDLVIGAVDFHDRTLQRLEELGVETLSVDITSWQSLEDTTEMLAARLGSNAQPLQTRYDACLAKAPETGPTTLVLASQEPLLSPNKESWAGDFLAQFNRPNLAAELQGESPFGGYVTLSEEKLLEADPEQIIVVDAGEDLQAQLEQAPFWQNLQAVQAGEVYSFEYFGLVNPGNLETIERVCDRLS
ncbi:MAG: ABC transporter substrate-binding protein [Cyanobacteria bacterium J06626_23]